MQPVPGLVDGVLFIPEYIFSAVKRNKKTIQEVLDLDVAKKILTPQEIAGFIYANTTQALDFCIESNKRDHLTDFKCVWSAVDYEYIEHVIEPLLKKGIAKQYHEETLHALSFSQSHPDVCNQPMEQLIGLIPGYIVAFRVRIGKDVPEEKQQEICRQIVDKYYSRYGYGVAAACAYYDYYKQSYLDK